MLQVDLTCASAMTVGGDARSGRARRRAWRVAGRRRSARGARAARLDAAGRRRRRCASGCPISRRSRTAASRDLPGNAYAVGFLRTYAAGARARPGRGRAPLPRRGARGQPQDRAELPGPGAGARRAGRRGRAARRACWRSAPMSAGTSCPGDRQTAPSRCRRCPSGWRRCADAAAGRHAVAAGRLDPAGRRRPPPADAGAAAGAAAPAAAAMPRRRCRPAAAAAARRRRPPPPAAAARRRQPRIVLRAKADAWIQVRDKQGQVLLNRVLRAGETWPVPPQAAAAADHRQCRRHRTAGGRRRRRARSARPAPCGATCRSTPTRSRTASCRRPAAAARRRHAAGAVEACASALGRRGRAEHGARLPGAVA